MPMDGEKIFIFLKSVDLRSIFRKWSCLLTYKEISLNAWGVCVEEDQD